MADSPEPRFARRNDEAEDQRSKTQRDRDRVLYASAFSRLGGVTQVVSSEEGHPYHNRLTHSLKVAQIARRVAEHLVVEQKLEAEEAGVDPDACEAAALAHDLGHPPFGHIAEQCLDALVRDESDGEVQGDPDGFEGNAQTFRIVTRLAQRRDEFDGLNLTRATLDGILKYPWCRSSPDDRSKYAKYGAYASERDTLDWVRQLHAPGDEARCANAEIMNWADDVAYAIHDVEDFYRAGLVPLDRLYWSENERRVLLDWLHNRWSVLEEQEGQPSPIPLDNWAIAGRTAERLFTELPPNRLTKPYAGERAQRKLLRRATALLIGRSLHAVGLQEMDGVWRLGFPHGDEVRHEVEFMKELVWYYVIDRPALRTQQHGQQRIITDLFTAYHTAAKEDLAVLPVSMREAVADGVAPSRAAADAVAALTERQAVVLWRKLTGTAQGTLLDHPVS
ncbi:MAG: dNTP triphosphohydrolase [Chloroflexota bacterium]|nr:dNTP triphosphohydrolase [Chloroflexota bacterium]